MTLPEVNHLSSVHCGMKMFFASFFVSCVMRYSFSCGVYSRVRERGRALDFHYIIGYDGFIVKLDSET